MARNIIYPDKERKQPGVKHPYVGGLRWAFWRWADIPSAKDSSLVYLRRLRILQTPWFAIYLHFIFEADEGRHPHDHPFAFWSVILRGCYVETLYDNPDRVYDEQDIDHISFNIWRPGSIHFMNRRRAHQITDLDLGTVTLVFCGRNHGDWGFWTPEGRIPWRDYKV